MVQDSATNAGLVSSSIPLFLSCLSPEERRRASELRRSLLRITRSSRSSWAGKMLLSSLQTVILKRLDVFLCRSPHLFSPIFVLLTLLERLLTVWSLHPFPTRVRFVCAAPEFLYTKACLTALCRPWWRRRNSWFKEILSIPR